MSSNSNFDRIAEAWLAEGPAQLADRVLDAALDEAHLTRQRRRLPVPWRFDLMFTPVRLAAAAVIGVLLVGIIYLNLPGQGDVGGPSPTSTLAPTVGPPASPSAAPTPTPAWQRYTSPDLGYTISFPGTWQVGEPAEDDLPEELFPGPNASLGDRFDEEVVHFPFVIVAIVPLSTTPEAWLDAYTAYLEACNPGEPESIVVAGSDAELRMGSCFPGTIGFDVVFVRDAEVVNIFWASSSGNEAAHRATFDQILESVAFTD